MTHDGEPECPFTFGPFLFDPQRGLLSHADGPLTLGSRVREILLLSTLQRYARLCGMGRMAAPDM